MNNQSLILTKRLVVLWVVIARIVFTFVLKWLSFLLGGDCLRILWDYLISRFNGNFMLTIGCTFRIPCNSLILINFTSHKHNVRIELFLYSLNTMVGLGTQLGINARFRLVGLSASLLWGCTTMICCCTISSLTFDFFRTLECDRRLVKESYVVDRFCT